MNPSRLPEVPPIVSRRNLFRGAGIGALGLGLAACSSSSSTTSSASATSSAGASASATNPTGTELTAVHKQVAIRIYGDDSHPAWHRRTMPIDAARARVPKFPAGSTVLKKGTIRRAGALPLPCDIVFERDVALKMRDGTTIYTNVFRPVGNEKVPAIFGWSPYGKEFGGQWLDDSSKRSGVPLAEVSELQRFEGADPAYWVNHGYAVLSPDPRGVGKSEGNISYWGRQLAEDGYDFIEWIAKQTWSSGKVAMSGNSFLAVAQWFIAAEQPPHLTAIAPWEGFSDHFREAGNRGGVPSPTFSEGILDTFSGPTLVEDQPLMMTKEQLLTPYWQDKTARLARVTVPAYVVASWTSPIHTHGSFAGFRQISSKEKWLRVHNTQEWTDYYDPAHVEDLRKFFDHYLKGVDTGWQNTPKVRLSILDPGGKDVVGRVEKEFPLARTQYTKLYLTTAGALSRTKQATAGMVSYEIAASPAGMPAGGAMPTGAMPSGAMPSGAMPSGAMPSGAMPSGAASSGASGMPSGSTSTSQVTFTMTMPEDTEITGYMSLRLWVEAKGSTDMELDVAVEKLDSAGKSYASGSSAITATGVMRVSQRALDKARSTPAEPLQAHKSEVLLKEGEIVPVDITIWPMGMQYHKGEKLQLTVSANSPLPFVPDLGFGEAEITVPADGGTYTSGSTVPMVTLGGNKNLPAFVTAERSAPRTSRNKGTHIFHLGGKYDSALLVPIVPKA